MALILALATLVLVMTSVTLLARRAGTLQLQRDLDCAGAIADDVLQQTESPILAWLERASTLVLPPDCDEPRMPVLRHEWIGGGRTNQLVITAWDQNGLVPFALARRAPLSSTQPTEVRKLLGRDTWDPDERDTPLGLDLFETWGQGLGPYPLAGGSTQPVLGSYIAMYSSRPWRLNVATAPLELVRQAMRMAGRGGWEAISEARRNGERPTVTAPPTGDTGLEEGPTLVVESDAFTFRIDVRIGVLTRSWWWTYVKRGTSEWRCIQRLGIPT